MNGPSPESLWVQYAPGVEREATRPLLSVIELSFMVAIVYRCAVACWASVAVGIAA